jgi:NAD dependent epimerase/dehydratase family enzyme
LALGELAELFVDGQRVVPERLLALKFVFRYPTIDAALAEALGTARGARPEASVSDSP